MITLCLTRTFNRAGQVLTENSQITGDPTNGTTTYTYDPLERLTSAARSGMSTLTYTWDEVPNRLTVQTGAGTPVATTYDAANRPKDQNGVSNVFSSDADGRLTTQPTAAGAAFQRYDWDSLGRLTTVKGATGTGAIATYTYDPLDRLRMVDYGANNRVRFRYVGLTTSVAQTIDDASGLVLRTARRVEGTGQSCSPYGRSGRQSRGDSQRGHQHGSREVRLSATGTGPAIHPR